MKKLVISLNDREDRRVHFQETNGWVENLEYFQAVNGWDVDHDQMRTNGFSIDHTWRDPFKFRRLTKGELGCYLSHYSVWQTIIEMNEPVLILEDDAIINRDLFDEALYEKYMNEGCGMLYLGYNENSDHVEDYDENTVIPQYPYNTHAYIITPETAKLLVNSGFHEKVIPVDEMLSAMLSQIEKPLALKEHTVKQALREKLSSDVEPTSDEDWFQDFKCHPITIGTDPEKCDKLVRSAKRYGFEVKNLGAGREWNGTDMSGPGGGQKVKILQEYLATLPENDVVLFTDAYDVFYTFDYRTITRRYLDMTYEIIFSAETAIWPNEEMAERHPPSHTKYQFLNSGGFIGRVGALRELFSKEIKPYDDDQLYIQTAWLDDTTKSITLDYEGYIFQTHEPNIKVKNGMIYNEETGCYGCVYHGNGGPEAKELFENLYTKIFGAPDKKLESGLYIPHMGRVECLDRDMLLIDFMTPSQCEQLIEIADNHGEWAPLPGDKFPAYEIRMKELGLWNDLQKHWEDNVYPIIEKYWWPIQMYGLRDAFVMRYSVDTQKKLAMHNDASLVTGSVKLNDNYEGASLRFPRQGIDNDDIPIGKCILFPGMVTHGHECTELISGVKYSFTMWSSRYPGDEN